MHLKKFVKKNFEWVAWLIFVLATEADYIDDEELKVSLLKEAYCTACEISDFKNKAYISSSLVELYLDEINDLIKAKYWINIFTSDLSLYSDDYLLELQEEFKSENYKLDEPKM